MQNKKFVVTVTGATGRLGKVVVPELVKLNGVSPRLLCRNLANCKKVFPGYERREVDLEATTVDELRRAVSGSNIVVHLAGLVDLIAPSKKLFDVNYNATCKLIKACELEKVQFFVHCSSIAVYSDSSSCISEDGKKVPFSSYGKSKLVAEKAVSSSSLKWIILRPGLIYGPEFKEGFVNLLEQMKKRRAAIIGSGDNEVPLVYELDVARAFASVVHLLITHKESSKVVRRPFNIVGDHITQREAYSELCSVFNLPAPQLRFSVPFVLGVARLTALFYRLMGKRPKFLPEYVQMLSRNRCFDTTRAKRVLGFRDTPLREGMQQVKKAWS